MWRWSFIRLVQRNGFRVFSTYVEMILTRLLWNWASSCILHVCGDDPFIKVGKGIGQVYSPRMWRWSFMNKNISQQWRVFSTYVEMILWHFQGIGRGPSILHVCGDDPHSEQAALQLIEVFSTYVEMILNCKLLLQIFVSILHVCGDDPKFVKKMPDWKMYSPRMWRWSYTLSYSMFAFYVFSTYVELLLMPPGMKILQRLGVGKITNSYYPVNKKCHIIQNILYLYNPMLISWMTW